MSDPCKLTTKVVAELLRRLRFLDISLAIRVYCGSPLADLPPHGELCDEKARIFWLAALTSHAESQSHSGLLLADGVRVDDLLPVRGEDASSGSLTVIDLLGTGEELVGRFPDLVVRADAAVESPGAFFVYRPAASLMYLHRWYALEAELGVFLRERIRSQVHSLREEFAKTFQRFFKPQETERNPWQAVACLAALRQPFSLVTGGPGTGKTTTVARLIGLLLSLPENDRPRQIQMVAPTGKAAERMRGAFARSFDKLLDDLPEEEAGELLRRKAHHLAVPSTIHAFLGSRGLGDFVHHAGNRASCDFLIVDEATMVDLDLFVVLFRALPADCRVVLMGDKNQLTAVETGNVFYDLATTGNGRDGRLNVFGKEFCRTFEEIAGVSLPAVPAPRPVLGDHVTELVHSYRFRTDSDVGQLANLLLTQERLPNKGELDLDMVTLEENWRPLVIQSMDTFARLLRSRASPEALLGELERSRILCAVRTGDAGVESLNALLCEAVLGKTTVPEVPQHGMPFMIIRNDRSLGLWNGDCGVFFEAPGGALFACLPPEPGNQEARRLDPYALPEWEPAFAMTIHKSQGSEYNAVTVMLPETRRPFISWELVYTGITRSCGKVRLVLPESFVGGKLSHVRRVSGLLSELGSCETIRVWGTA